MYHIMYRSEPRAEHIAWTPPSHPDTIVLFGGHNTGTEQNAEIVPGSTCENILNRRYFFRQGGTTFALVGKVGKSSCAIPDGETVVLTGGRTHKLVTR